SWFSGSCVYARARAESVPVARPRLVSFRRRLNLRIKVVGHLRRGILIGPAVDDRLEIEISMSRRAGGGPFQRVGMPRVAPHLLAVENAVDEVHHENDLRGAHRQ